VYGDPSPLAPSPAPPVQKSTVLRPSIKSPSKPLELNPRPPGSRRLRADFSLSWSSRSATSHCQSKNLPLSSSVQAPRNELKVALGSRRLRVHFDPPFCVLELRDRQRRVPQDSASQDRRAAGEWESLVAVKNGDMVCLRVPSWGTERQGIRFKILGLWERKCGETGVHPGGGGFFEVGVG
jgi:hypothetical protein